MQDVAARQASGPASSRRTSQSNLHLSASGRGTQPLRRTASTWASAMKLYGLAPQPPPEQQPTDVDDAQNQAAATQAQPTIDPVESIKLKLQAKTFALASSLSPGVALQASMGLPVDALRSVMDTSNVLSIATAARATIAGVFEKGVVDLDQHLVFLTNDVSVSTAVSTTGGKSGPGLSAPVRRTSLPPAPPPPLSPHGKCGSSRQPSLHHLDVRLDSSAVLELPQPLNESGTMLDASLSLSLSASQSGGLARHKRKMPSALMIPPVQLTLSRSNLSPLSASTVGGSNANINGGSGRSPRSNRGSYMFLAQSRQDSLETDTLHQSRHTTETENVKSPISPMSPISITEMLSSLTAPLVDVDDMDADAVHHSRPRTLAQRIREARPRVVTRARPPESARLAKPLVSKAEEAASIKKSEAVCRLLDARRLAYRDQLHEHIRSHALVSRRRLVSLETAHAHAVAAAAAAAAAVTGPSGGRRHRRAVRTYAIPEEWKTTRWYQKVSRERHGVRPFDTSMVSLYDDDDDGDEADGMDDENGGDDGEEGDTVGDIDGGGRYSALNGRDNDKTGADGRASRAGRESVYGVARLSDYVRYRRGESSVYRQQRPRAQVVAQSKGIPALSALTMHIEMSDQAQEFWGEGIQNSLKNNNKHQQRTRTLCQMADSIIKFKHQSEAFLMRPPATIEPGTDAAHQPSSSKHLAPQRQQPPPLPESQGFLDIEADTSPAINSAGGVGAGAGGAVLTPAAMTAAFVLGLSSRATPNFDESLARVAGLSMHGSRSRSSTISGAGGSGEMDAQGGAQTLVLDSASASLAQHVLSQVLEATDTEGDGRGAGDDSNGRSSDRDSDADSDEVEVDPTTMLAPGYQAPDDFAQMLMSISNSRRGSVTNSGQMGQGSGSIMSASAMNIGSGGKLHGSDRLSSSGGLSASSSLSSSGRLDDKRLSAGGGGLDVQREDELDALTKSIRSMPRRSSMFNAMTIVKSAAGGTGMSVSMGGRSPRLSNAAGREDDIDESDEVIDGGDARDGGDGDGDLSSSDGRSVKSDDDGHDRRRHGAGLHTEGLEDSGGLRSGGRLGQRRSSIGSGFHGRPSNLGMPAPTASDPSHGHLDGADQTHRNHEVHDGTGTDRPVSDAPAVAHSSGLATDAGDYGRAAHHHAHHHHHPHQHQHQHQHPHAHQTAQTAQPAQHAAAFAVAADALTDPSLDDSWIHRSKDADNNAIIEIAVPQLSHPHSTHGLASLEASLASTSTSTGTDMGTGTVGTASPAIGSLPQLATQATAQSASTTSLLSQSQSQTSDGARPVGRARGQRRVRIAPLDAGVAKQQLVPLRMQELIDRDNLPILPSLHAPHYFWVPPSKWGSGTTALGAASAASGASGASSGGRSLKGK
ncbi:hypothetical protein BC831DRAFT_447244 [Entophlyctis helioformis]|nr:hypothetical protein BC831DRAFT_447244 [Entophlyctis helioformis]